MNLIDSHCHLERSHLKGELDAIIANAQNANIKEIINVGTNIDDSKIYAELASKYSGILHYSVGIHPSELSMSWESDVASLKDFWDLDVKPVAIGEVGLDYYRLPLKQDPEKSEKLKMIQKMVLRAQLDIAGELGCPVIMHSRSAFHDSLEAIDQSSVEWSKVVFHCFGDSEEEVKLLNERGGRASFTGIVTYKNADNVRNSLKMQGIDKLMIETDAPYLAPMPHRGENNEPAYLCHTAEYCAELLGVELEEFASITTRNTQDFFGL